jgi:hypothetical protein
MEIKISLITRMAALCLFFFSSPVIAQSDSLPAVTTSAGVDLVSRYVWRGLDIGKAPSIQPGLSASWKGFTIGAWGAYKLNGPGDQETDLYLSKTVGFVTVAIWDYWAFNDSNFRDIFDYREETTAHVLEAQLQLAGGEVLPFNFLASYFFYGADDSRSVYLELTWLPEIRSADLLVFAGYQARGTYYAPGKSFVNLGCTFKKPIPVTERFNLPMSLSLVVSPDAKSAYLIAGITL